MEANEIEWENGRAVSSGPGILSANYLQVFQMGNPVNWAVVGLSSVVGGMMYPVSVLPTCLRYVARLTPITYSLEGMRAAVLGHPSILELWPSLAAPLAFATLLLPISFAVFSWALAPDKNYERADALLTLPKNRLTALYSADSELGEAPCQCSPAAV
jgi:hypothetical protein